MVGGDDVAPLQGLQRAMPWASNRKAEELIALSYLVNHYAPTRSAALEQ